MQKNKHGYINAGTGRHTLYACVPILSFAHIVLVRLHLGGSKLESTLKL